MLVRRCGDSETRVQVDEIVDVVVLGVQVSDVKTND